MYVHTYLHTYAAMYACISYIHTFVRTHIHVCMCSYVAFVSQISHEEAFVMAEQMEQRVLDVEHVSVLTVKHTRVDEQELFARLRFESGLFHNLDGLTCLSIEIA